MTDRTLKERYRLDNKLGEGGMATVYAGTDALLRRRVAIKVLRPQFSADAEFVKRFYHEAESVARLSYPNIVSIYDVGREDETYFIVMELVDGSTLAELIDSDQRLPEAVVIDYAEQICRALAYAHRQGILHRDVKPANILITSDDVVKLSDFGIARAVTTQTMTLTSPGMVMGSVYYLSPEQAQGNEVRETSDLYSLGVVLFQMLTGRLPYTGESPVTVALKHVSNPVPEIPVGDGISPGLAAIVKKLLQKDPADRYQSATEVSAALRAARDEQPFDVAVARTQPLRRVPPKPPPRRSQSPDRPMRTPVHEPFVDDDEPAPSRVPAYAGLAVLLILAALAGYYLTGRPGGVFGPSATVVLPNVVGRSSADAGRILAAKGLRFTIVTAASESAPRDRVLGQRPPPAAVVASDATIQLTVSSGMPSVDIVDLRAYSLDDAERYLRNAKMNPKVVEDFNAAPRGTVLKQAPGPGRVPLRSVVTLTVSKGPPPVIVPAVVSLTLDQALTMLHQAGLTADAERVPSDNIPEGVVSSQNPDPGKAADRGASVTLQVSAGPSSVALPDVTGRSVGDASAALNDAGMLVRLEYSLQPGDPVGTVLDESPAAGSQLKHGAAVTLTIVVSGIVPDVTGMTLDQSRIALQNAGYAVGNVAYTQNGSDGKVASTEPPGGSSLRPGETVTIYYNSGTGGAATSAPSAAPTSSAAPTP
jgi:eukaryotic-like serine/threonine-protein kinase